MKNETIYKKLIEIKESNNFIKLDELIKELEKDIRKNTAYKRNSKARVNAIARMFKNYKGSQTLTDHYYYNDNVLDKYYFTDSYQLYCLNDSLEYPQAEKNINSISHFFDSMPLDNEILIDQDEVLANIKMKIDSYKINNNYSFKNEYLKSIFDILGSDITIYLSNDNEKLYAKNNDGELALILAQRTY